MRFLGKIPLFIVAALAWVVIISSCANQGMPTGGPQDSLPPILLNTQPKYQSLNFKGDEVRFTFDEYLATDKISEELVVSPPLEKRPTIYTKSKTLIIKFNEDLKDSSTYSMDFKNSIVDNNEQNPYKNMRFSFSTGDVYDSLRVAGRVANSFNMEPVEKALVMLYKNLHDSAIYTTKPDFIGKTDEFGVFMIDNIPPGKYHLYAINDANSDLKYNEGAEEIAFYDSLVVPAAVFEEELDTLVKGVDSLLIMGHTQFFPEPIYINQFTEDLYDQYMKTFSRASQYKCIFSFAEPVSDTLGIRLLNAEAKDWYILEPDKQIDSLTMWITDTTIAKMDTLSMEISYFQLDSMKQLYLNHDTLEMKYTPVEQGGKNKKRGKSGEKKETLLDKLQKGGKENEDGEKPDEPLPPPPVVQFSWINSNGSTVELNEIIKIMSPEPLKNLNENGIRLYLSADTLKTPLGIEFSKDTAEWRTYDISYKWEPETNYTLEIDSAAAENIYGITSAKLKSNFTTRDESYYGRIIVDVEKADSPVVLQLLKNDDKETVILEKKAKDGETATFDFLTPDKYKIKAIIDKNGNGKWDTGSFQDKNHAEQVYYWPNVIKVRSNWDWKTPGAWDLSPNPTYTKKVIDKEAEEQKRKQAEEQAKKDQKKQEKTSPFKSKDKTN